MEIRSVKGRGRSAARELEKRQTVKYATAGGAFQGASTLPPVRKLFCQKSF
jgi:hypothetical protein